jgi:hypothetical protein
MASDFRVDGADVFRGVGRALKQAGDGRELKKDLARELRNAGKPAAEEMRAKLRGALPSSNGLAALFTKKKFSVRNRFAGDGAGISISTGTGHQFSGVERSGTIRHPVFGGPTWVVQSVGGSGVLERTFAENADEFADGVASALDATLQRLVTSIDRAS